jgi:CitB family two-component system sensor histidine kinase MalK
VDATPAATYLKSVLETGRPVFDRELVIRDLHLVSSVVPVMAGPRITGVVATFRDKTEVIQLAEQMSGVRIYAEALRAQTHEFINKLHVILGLVRLGEFERLATFLAGLTGNLQDDVGHVIPRIKDPVIAGFLLARFSAAREQNITMRLSETSQMPNCLSDSATHDIVTILGNLLENAVEAMGDSLCREIHVHLQHDQECLVITVEDTGRGIRPEHLDWLFERGFTTKEGDRGHGLHLVAQRLAELRGRIEVSRRAGGGTIFSASFSFPDTLPV